MKHSSRSKWPLIFKVIVLSLLLLFTLFAHHTRAFAEGATISTDKTDYEPEETVTYAGSGFQPAEIVDILAAGSTNGSTIIRQATADENGNFTGSFELSRTFEANYQLTAAGSSSGLIAQASFYDRLENFVFVAPYPMSPPVYLKPYATQVYKVLATNQAGNGVNNAPIVWSAQGGSIGSITPSDSKTDNNGNSTATYTAGSTEGTFVVSAVATGGGNGGVDLPASPTETVVIDGTAPVITASAKTADNQPYTAGTWTKQNVNVDVTGTDVITQGVQSGVQSSTAPVTVSTEGDNQSVPGTCTDKAGNSASTTFSRIKIDKTAPTLSFGAATPTATATVCNNTNESFTNTTADTQTDVASSI